MINILSTGFFNDTDFKYGTFFMISFLSKGFFYDKHFKYGIFMISILS